MSSQVATMAYGVLIAALFLLNRDRSGKTSKFLWIPTLWLLINGSRPVSQWFQSGPIVGDQYQEGSPLDAIVYGVLLLAALTVLVLRKQQVKTLLRSNLPILLFLGYCGISTLWSDYSFVAFKRWNKAIGDVAMILIVFSEVDPVVAIRRLISRTAFILVPSSILLIKYYPDLGRSYNPWTWLPMYCGVTTFKNLLGMTCLVSGLGSVWCVVTALKNPNKTLRWRRVVAHGIVITMVIWLLHTADSMTSFSCFMMASFVCVAASLRFAERHRWCVPVLALSMVGLAVTALFLDASGSMVQSLGRDASLTGRTAIWHAVIMRSGNPLIGMGFESFWTPARTEMVARLSGEAGIQSAHNGYLETYVNIGWLGLFFLTIVGISGYRNVVRILRINKELGVIKLSYFVAALVYSFTEAGFRMMSPVWIGFLLAVVALSKSSLRTQSQSVTKEDTLEMIGSRVESVEAVYASKETQLATI